MNLSHVFIKSVMVINYEDMNIYLPVASLHPECMQFSP